MSILFILAITFIVISCICFFCGLLSNSDLACEIALAALITCGICTILGVTDAISYDNGLTDGRNGHYEQIVEEVYKNGVFIESDTTYLRIFD